MARFLVTGGAGFIGSHLAAELTAQKHDVRILDDLSTGFLGNLDGFRDSVEFVEGDVCDRNVCFAAVEGVDCIFHQAALASVPRSVEDPLSSHATNATGTLNLLLAAKESGVHRFVYAGSSSAYGNRGEGAVSEHMRPMPLSPYAASKVSGEHYLEVFAECYGLETVTLRYFNVFGPRQDPNSPYSAVIPLFVSAMACNERPKIHGDGLQARDFCYVANNVSANLKAAAADLPAKANLFNISCGDSYTVLDLFNKIREFMNVDIEPEFVAPRVGDVRMSKADISQARRDLGYEVVVPFEEGLQKTVAWYKEQLQQGTDPTKRG